MGKDACEQRTCIIAGGPCEKVALPAVETVAFSNGSHQNFVQFAV